MQIYGQLVQTIYQKKPFMFHRMTMHDLEYKIYETGKLSMKFPQWPDYLSLRSWMENVWHVIKFKLYCVSKNDTALACYNVDVYVHQPILII